ncbi:unnamed protein product, partial [Caenorhabditis brenneri]
MRARAAAGRPEEPAYLRSETLRLLKEQEHGSSAGTTLSNHPNPSGLPVCFMCTRPILGVMARAAGKNLHGDCLSCATCGNSLRNVGHHFIEDKFYCDIHGTQRKAGGRPGMDPNIFVKSSPTAAQPVHIQDNSPRAAYHPQINQTARPVSVSPAPSAGSRQVTTHYHTPKTQGILSPAQRGVPNAAFGADLSKTVTYGGGVGPGGTHYDPNRLSPAPSQFSQSSRGQNPPPVPSNPPPNHESSRVPDSVRSAVSPRRSGKVPRQWPPPPGPATNRYWQIDPADALKKEKDKLNYGEDLAALIREVEQQGKPEGKPAKVGKPKANPELDKLKAVSKPAPKAKTEPKPKKVGRRASNISKEQVQQAFEEHRKRQEAKAEGPKPDEPEKPQPELKIEVDPPRIQDGIHWTVIHSPQGQESPAKVSSEAAPASNGVVKPIPSYAVAQPIKISKTATPQPFRPVQAGKAGQAGQERPHYSSVGLKEVAKENSTPVPAPRSPQLAPPTSYIVRSSDANITTSTDLQTTVTRQYTELLAAPHPDTIDQSTSPIPTIRLHRHTSHEAGKADAGTSPIKIQEPRSWVPTSGVRIHEPTGPEAGPVAYRTLTTSPKPFQKSMATSPIGGGLGAAYQADQEAKPLSQEAQYRQSDQDAKPLFQEAQRSRANQGSRYAQSSQADQNAKPLPHQVQLSQADQGSRYAPQSAQAAKDAKPLSQDTQRWQADQGNRYAQPSQADQDAKPLSQQAQYRQADQPTQPDYQRAQAGQPAKPLPQEAQYRQAAQPTRPDYERVQADQADQGSRYAQPSQADQVAKPLPQTTSYLGAAQPTRPAYQADQDVKQLPQQAQYRQAVTQADYEGAQADQLAKPLPESTLADQNLPYPGAHRSAQDAPAPTPQRPVWQRRQPSSDLDPDQPILDQDQVGRPQAYPGLDQPSLSEPSQVNPELARMDQVGRPQAYPDQAYPDQAYPVKDYLKRPQAIRKDPKHFKKVDFSKTSPTVIPEWKDSADIIDESDILTECSKEDDSYLKAATYDGDESEMIDNKSDVSTFDIEEEEILDSGRQKIRVVGKSHNGGGGDAEKQWRQRAMELLDDDAQTERDLMIVAALNERLQGFREMEDDDRVRAIECIARHQSELEQTQTQLSTLLESAIVYLQNLRPPEDQDTPEPARAEERVQDLRKKVLEDLEQLPILGEGPPPPPERKVFPFQSYQPKGVEDRGVVESPVTQSLHDVLDEFYSIRKTTPLDPVEDSRNFLAARLGHVMNLDEEEAVEKNNGQLQGSSYTKTSFERTTTDTRPVSQDTVGARSAGHLTTTTTTTQQQNGGRVPYCEACKQQIRGAFVLATGKSWCPEHFVCANSSCRRRLLECGFVEEDGQKFCEQCFEQHIAPRCAKCSKPIISDCLNALQKKWHPTCFTCAHCQKPFGNSAFYLEQGLPYCEQDWNALFTTKCVSCRYPIEAGDRWVEALGNAFHSNCFTCA